MAGFQAGPDRTIEDTMIILEMFFAAQTRHPQDGCDGSFSSRKDCADQQYSGMFPNTFREQPRKGSKDRDLFSLQGRHWLPRDGVFALAYPAFC